MQPSDRRTIPSGAQTFAIGADARGAARGREHPARVPAQLVTDFKLLALVLFHTSLRDTILRALTPALASYTEPALAISFALAAFWACTARIRGSLAMAITTGSLTASGAIAHRGPRRHRLDRPCQSRHQRRHAWNSRRDHLLCSQDSRQHMAFVQAGVVRGKMNGDILLGVR